MIVTCPECGTKNSARALKPGMTYRCGKCGKVLRTAVKAKDVGERQEKDGSVRLQFTCSIPFRSASFQEWLYRYSVLGLFQPLMRKATLAVRGDSIVVSIGKEEGFGIGGHRVLVSLPLEGVSHVRVRPIPRRERIVQTLLSTLASWIELMVIFFAIVIARLGWDKFASGEASIGMLVLYLAAGALGMAVLFNLACKAEECWKPLAEFAFLKNAEPVLTVAVEQGLVGHTTTELGSVGLTVQSASCHAEN